MTVRASDLVLSLEASNQTLRGRVQKSNQRVRALESRVAELESEVSALKPRVGLPPVPDVPWGMSPSQNAIFTLLMSREIVSEDAIREVLYSSRAGDEPTSNAIHGLLWWVRQKLIARGYRLVNRREIGWFIPAETKTRIRASLKQGDDHAAAIPTDPTLNPPAAPPRRTDRGVPAAPR